MTFYVGTLVSGLRKLHRPGESILSRGAGEPHGSMTISNPQQAPSVCRTLHVCWVTRGIIAELL